jgi:ribosomal protein L11 methyltransferase
VIRLSVRVPRARADLVLAELLELAPAGIEEVELSGALVEYAVYGSPGELPDLPDLQTAVGGVPVEVVTADVPDDWSERWKQFHRPVLVEVPARRRRRPANKASESRGAPLPDPPPSLYVRPPWAEASAADGVQEIVIDPGQAFGTGAHATTRLCLELLLELAVNEPSRGPVLDAGSGSGVLAIAAAKLGYGPVLALDNERESVVAIQANAQANGVEIETRRFDLRREPLPAPGGAEPAPGGAEPLPGPRGDSLVGSAAEGGGTVVLANLLRPLLLHLVASMDRPPAHMIASGLLREEADEVANAFSGRLGLRERERRERGEWAALWLLNDRIQSNAAAYTPRHYI